MKTPDTTGVFYFAKGDSMDNAAMAELVRKEVKKKFRGNQKLDTKVAMHFPNNLVREYTRITDAYMRILSETMKEHLPEIEEVLHREEMFRTDDVQSFWDSIKAILRRSATRWMPKPACSD